MPVPNAAFFQKLGLLLIPGFLDPDDCRRIDDEMNAKEWSEGTVGGGNDDVFVVDREYRRTRLIDVPQATFDDLAARLNAIRADVAAHYKIEIADCQRPQFLAYGPGDFYKPHRDRVPRDTARFSAQRQVTAVIFINRREPAPAPGVYGGGELTLFEMFDDPTGGAIGLPVDPEPGLLVTFPSTKMHSVAPVTHGERRTVVSWFI